MTVKVVEVLVKNVSLFSWLIVPNIFSLILQIGIALPTPYASRLSYRKAEPLAQLGLVGAIVDGADEQSSVASGNLAQEEWY